MTMKFQNFLFGLHCLAIFAAPAAPQATAPGGGSAVNISGEITLVQAGSTQIERDASKVVVWLVPVSSYRPASLAAERQRYRLVQHNKRFEPELLVVPVGSVVDFPNLDPWFHNVFSLYRGKRFDLGLYQAGSVRSVSFDRPGPSYLFCNIHPEMTGVVLAVDSDWFAVSDKSGHYALSGVPPGNYILHVWYENAALDALQALRRPIVIEAGSRSMPAISVPVNKQMPAEHKNKYGQAYDPNTLKTDY
jgi:plastocyanin